jgi:TonB family protein
MSWWQYLLLVNIYLVLFYVFYVLLLRKETFFQLNRVYLVAAALLSFFIPAIQADWVQNLVITQQVKQTIYSLPVMELQVTPTENNYIRMGEILALFYLGGIMVLSARLAWQLFKLKKVLSMPKADAPYSFFKKVRLDESSQDNAVIEAHEHVHAQQWHSADVLLVEMVMIINWFNPIVYFYRSTIKHIHEYIADRQAVLAGTNKADYALLLLRQTFDAPPHYLVNPFFNHSLLKKRIIMLQKNRSQRISLIKYGLSAPLFILMLILSSATINNSAAVNTINDKAQELFITPANELDLSGVVGNNNANAIVAPTDTVDKDAVFSEVEQIPEFPGGIEAFSKFLAGNVRYPKAARDKGVEGRVLCTFIVEKNGALSNIKIAKSVEADIDAESVRVLKLSPKWNPGIQNHHKVRVQFTVPINFTLAGDRKKKTTTAAISGNKQAYSSVESLPDFPGGVEAFGKFLAKNTRYPKNAREKNIQGRVICTFVVERDGSLSGITVLRGVDPEIDEESVRVLKLSPKWTPGMQGKEKVRTQFSVPISFTLADDKKTGAIKQESKTSKMAAVGKSGNIDTIVKKQKETFVIDVKDNGLQPLYVLNGESITANQLKAIDVNTIESISVLKDKNATELYGPKAINGVVLVSTKADSKSKTLKLKPVN